MRRRALLTASGGGSNLTFPITLQVGDNGQIGVDLFKYADSHSVATGGQYIYYFKDDELVTSTTPEGTQFQILEFLKISDDTLVYRAGNIDGYTTLLYLMDDGNVRIMQM